MRRRWILVTAGAVSLLTLLIVYSRRPETVPQVDLQTPPHYFIAANHFARDELRCSLTLGLDPTRLHDLWSLPIQPCRLGRGWSVPNKRGVMAYAMTAEIEFFTEYTDWTHVLLRIKAVAHPAGNRQQKITARLNGRRLAAVELRRGWRTIVIEVPRGTLRSDRNTFGLSFAYRASSSESGTSKSQPRFAVRLREISLIDSPPPRGPFSDLRRRIIRRYRSRSSRERTQVFDPSNGRFTVRTAGTLVVPIDLPATAEWLEFSTARSDPSDRRPDRLTVNLRGLDDGSSISASAEDLENYADADEQGHAYRIPVDQLAGQPCALSIEIGAIADESQPVMITIPTLSVRSRPVDVGPTAPQELAAAQRPDIVLITLDAARPDTFSCYGYERPTTPNIDRLAESSLVFTNVFALVPNTHRSVPTMVTGLSFLNHGVTEEESVLNGSATTLAESLGEAGYRTACFTANPNNSRRTGTDQGYDEFFELWAEVPRSTSRRPDYLAARAVEWLDTLDEKRPFHLQLHFVPPHAPYDPAPEFDLFSDSNYRGDCDGTAGTLRAIDKANLVATGDDLAHIRSLYDGNLRAADAAVETVLEALASRPRWKNTLILVTSDHGEAFFEHGRMLHNNTVYDEMLRVPFILRPPRATDIEGVDTGRTATLEDVVPTLLAAGSIRPAARLDGVDLLEPTRPAGTAGFRSVIARTAHPSPMRCLRTRSFKLILSPSGQIELYDLSTDPGEHRNVAFENLPVAVALGQILTRRLVLPPRLDRTARQDDLPSEQRDLLKTLGYLE